MGQPEAVTIATAGQTVRLAYTLTEARAVSLQAISQATPPTLAILHGDTTIAATANAEASLIITLNAYLPAGDYVVAIGAVGGSTGSIIVAVQSETPIVLIPLPAGNPIQGQVTAQAPLAVYTFSALFEPAYLYVDSLLLDSGPQVRLRNLSNDRVIAAWDGELLGARLTIPARIAQYQLEIAHSGPANDQPFTLCFSPVSANACAGGAVVAPPITGPAETQSSAMCTVTPLHAGGANIRQTISVNAPVLVALPGGAVADVLGISPDGAWYQVTYNGVTGWSALSAVTSSGMCGNLTVFNPPPIPTPVPPTATPTMPPPTVPLTPSGPCLVTFTAPELIYTQPQMLPDYIFDQMPTGGQLIPIGRWNADPSWYKSNAGTWWLNTAGTAGVLSGDCSNLPLVSWP